MSLSVKRKGGELGFRLEFRRQGVSFKRGLRRGLRLSGPGGRHQFGQAVIGLRTHHHIDDGGSAHDLAALGLGHAPGDGDGHLIAVGALKLHIAQAAKVGKQLLGGFFADMAGIDQDKIGLFGLFRQFIALRGQDIGHALAVIDIHLTAIGLDVQAFGARLGDIGHEALSLSASSSGTPYSSRR